MRPDGVHHAAAGVFLIMKIGDTIMARPVKWRKIDRLPTVKYFVPSENGMSAVQANILKLEELEAVRLKDLEGLEQSECALKMEVSRQTFQRILLSAREKIADSLVNGKPIRVAGGNFTQNVCLVRCLDCGREWTDSFENITDAAVGGYACPACRSRNIHCGQNCGGAGRGSCHRHGRNK
jgi:predicted DNA-binding protein (UPF0251 family)/DNA-directed RNA polymerase subunit RPC12/RpoP